MSPTTATSKLIVEPRYQSVTIVFHVTLLIVTSFKKPTNRLTNQLTNQSTNTPTEPTNFSLATSEGPAPDHSEHQVQKVRCCQPSATNRHPSSPRKDLEVKTKQEEVKCFFWALQKPYVLFVASKSMHALVFRTCSFGLFLLIGIIEVSRLFFLLSLFVGASNWFYCFLNDSFDTARAWQ